MYSGVHVCVCADEQRWWPFEVDVLMLWVEVGVDVGSEVEVAVARVDVDAVDE